MIKITVFHRHGAYFGEGTNLPPESSSAEFKIRYPDGSPFKGTLTAAGVDYPITDGTVKIPLCSRFCAGVLTLTLTTEGGVIIRCPAVLSLSSRGWIFPSPREAISDRELLSLLAECDLLSERAAAASPTPVSPVLGF